jgi:DNA methylase
VSVDLRFGDNVDVLSSLRAEGRRVHLAYLDPPWKTERSLVYKPPGGGREEHAYDDHWTSMGAFVGALRERVVLVRELLSEDGALLLHLDPVTSPYVKVMLDEVFGPDCFRNEIVWKYRRWPTPQRNFQRMHDVLFRYVRTNAHPPRWTQLYEALAPSALQRGCKKQRKAWVPSAPGATRGKSVGYEVTDEDSPGAFMSDVWTDIGILAPNSPERTGYPTQKPEALLERIITACSLRGDTVLDPYAGSATSAVVARKLGRHWIGIGASAVAVRVARARLAIGHGLPVVRRDPYEDLFAAALRTV